MLLILKSLIFNLLFYTWTVVIVLGAIPGLVLGRHWIHLLARAWGVGIEFFLRLVGITVEIRGRDHLPQEPVIVASKHQSVWDTTMIEVLVPGSVIILKRELTLIPLFGQLLLKAGAISVNRSKGRSVIPQMIKGAKNAQTQGRSVFIFPEGTRTKAGERGTYRYGTFALYEGTGMKVVPAALNSGFFWPRRKFLKYPGKIVFEFLPPIEPGLSDKEFMKTLEDRIESASEKLNPFNTKHSAPSKEIKEVPASRKRSLIIAAFICMSLVGYTLLWLQKAYQLEARVKHEIASINQSNSASFKYERLTITGFPWKLEIKLKNPDFIYHGFGKSHFKIDGKLEIESTVWAPRTIKIKSLGMAKVLYSPGPLYAKIKLKCDDIEGIFKSNDKGYTFKNLHFYDLKMKILDQTVNIEEVSLSKALKTERSFFSRLAWSFASKTITSPERNHSAISAKLQGIKVNDHLYHTLPSLIETFEATVQCEEDIDFFAPNSIKTWSEKGGVLEIEKFALNWGNLKGEGSGTLALDHDLQPLAAVTVTLAGLEPFIDELALSRIINSNTASIIKFSLSLFKVNDRSLRGLPQHKVAIGLQKGDLSIGPVTIAKLPIIKWPAEQSPSPFIPQE